MFRKLWLFSFIIIIQLLLSCSMSNLPSIKTLDKYYKEGTAAQEVSEAYLISPGDVLAVDVWKEKDLSRQVSVRLDGKISLPLVNDIQAAGFTCEELQKHIEEKFKDFLGEPAVSVTLLQSNSSRIYILGKVGSPGEYPLQKKMTLLQAISRAGGLGTWADTSDVRLIRKINGVEKTFRVDYDAIVSGKDLSQNIELKPDDTVFVP